MLEILVIWKPLNNQLKFKFLVKIMKMCVGMVAILSIWWSPDRFRHLQHVEFDVKFIFFLKINEVT
jgi:hypothetical protein